MARYGRAVENGREEAWAEDDDFTFRNDAYTVRCTALYPYKDYANGQDELYCTIDWTNVTKGTSGRFEKVWVDARNPNETSGQLRRHSVYRTLRRLLAAPQSLL